MSGLALFELQQFASVPALPGNKCQPDQLLQRHQTSLNLNLTSALNMCLPFQATIAGLTVAFLDGCYDAATYGPEEGAPPARAGHTSVNSGRDGLYRYSRRDVAELHRAVQKLEGEVDVLLTCEWPRGITAGGLKEGKVDGYWRGGRGKRRS